MWKACNHEYYYWVTQHVCNDGSPNYNINSQCLTSKRIRMRSDDPVSPTLTQPHPVSPSLTQSHLVSPSLTQSHPVSPIGISNVQVVDAVLEAHDFMGLWFPLDQKSTEHVSSTLQFHELAARLESMKRAKRMIWKRSKSISNGRSDF